VTSPNIKKAYFEITNVCNLSCSFCPGTKRHPAFVSLDEFRKTAEKLKGRIPYLYLHLMGEPTVHPELEDILDTARDMGFKTILTTNGTTLPQKKNVLLKDGRLYKISVSLHSFEANDKKAPSMEGYLDGCFDFVREASEMGVISVLRLWNLDGENTVGENMLNSDILTRMRQFFGDEWVETRSGMRLCDKVFLEFAEKFEWPSSAKGNERAEDSDFFCHGLRDQIGILCDGTVVPCCLDSEGSISLGNIFKSSLDEILSTDAVKEFYNAVSARRCPSALCRSCGYSARFSKKK